MALKRLDREYEATIKAEIKEEDNCQNEKKMMMTGDDDSKDEEQNNNYQQLDEIDDHLEHGDFGEFEEYGTDTKNKLQEIQFDEKRIEFAEEVKNSKEKIIICDDNLNQETKENINQEAHSKKQSSSNLPKFNETEKEKIKNAMKQINIKPPNWAKKYFIFN